MTTEERKAMGLMAGGVALGIAGAWLIKRTLTEYTFRDKVVIVTGGSRGLGLVMARQLAKEGARLAILARDPAELRAAAFELAGYGAKVLPLTCDVRDRWQVEDAVRRVARRFGGIDMLINNAGQIAMSPLANQTLDDFHEMMETHCWGSLHATLAALPHMRARGGGRVCNIASIGGRVALPHLAAYSCSKFALVGLSESLRVELWRENILVTTALPGLMRTGSHQAATFCGQHEKEFTWFVLGDAVPGASISAERAARQILNAVRRGQPEVTVTLLARAVILLNALFPNASARVFEWSNHYLLPPPVTTRDGESRRRAGWQVRPGHAPSVVLKHLDKAAAENNEPVAGGPARAPAGR